MRHLNRLIKITIVLFLLYQGNTFSSITTGKYAGEFLAVGVGARYLAMGGTAAASADDITAMYWNPAGLGFLSMTQMHAMHSERFAGIVNWDFIGIGVPLKHNRTLGFGFFRLGVDGVPLTKLYNESDSVGIGKTYFDESGRPIQNVPYAYKYVNPNDAALFISYAINQNPRFKFGGTIKMIRRSAGDYTAWGVGFDIGTIYQAASWMHLGATVKDLTSTLLAWSNGTKELILPQIRLGFLSPMRLKHFGIRVASDVLINFEDRSSVAQVSLGRAGFDFFSGLELNYLDRIGIRAGIDRGAFTIGTGFNLSSIHLDYGFLAHSDLGSTHRISVTLTDTKNLFNLNR
ncbi:PorV/PorQ family protein [candidate division KSB1 bacterium]|nr:PorV/PorQ family protein [candidate division KSB1 bacterium]